MVSLPAGCWLNCDVFVGISGPAKQPDILVIFGRNMVQYDNQSVCTISGVVAEGSEGAGQLTLYTLKYKIAA